MSSGPDIIEYIRDDRYLGPDEQISVPQVAVLKAIYGLSMTKVETEAFLDITEGRPARRGGYSMAWIVIGQRSGKTDKILANIAAYEIFMFNPEVLSPGERAYFPIVAQDVEGAGQARGYIEGKLRLLEARGFPVLDHGEAQSRAVTGKEIRCHRGVSCKCFPCSKASVRGITAIGYGTDEVAWWRTQEGAYNADVEVMRALRGRIATIGRQAKRVNVTSPYAEEGVVWEAWEKRHTSRELVVNCPSWVFNPNLDAGFLADEQRDDPVAYLRDYGGQFGKEGGGYFAPGEVDKVIDRARAEILPHSPGHQYAAAIDVAHKRDLYALAIGHLEDGGRVVFDLIAAKQGSRKAPLKDDEVASEYAGYLREYGLDKVIGDQHFDLAIVKEYDRHGIRVIIEPQSEKTSYEMMNNLGAVVRRGLTSVPDMAIIRKDLLSLKRMRSGQYPRIAAPEKMGFHDDISKAMAVVLMKLLPMSSRVDLAEMNRGAMAAATDPDTDWSDDIMGATL